jgi:hypothetical protein
MSSLRYEALAKEWHAQARLEPLLLSGYDLIRLRCWSYSAGAKSEGVSATLRDFVRESNAAQPEDWLDDYLYDRETCSTCGEGYRLENMRLCTHCSRMYCYRCPPKPAKAPNGNDACPCGGELVG